MRVVGLAVVVGLPFLGHWLRQAPADACALDGAKIDPLFRVRIVDDRDQSHSFCCIACATIWLKRNPQPARAIFVTDETTGKEIESASAFYVRSSVVTQRAMENHTHVFEARTDAETHAAQCGGTVLLGPDRPFKTSPQR